MRAYYCEQTYKYKGYYVLLMWSFIHSTNTPENEFIVGVEYLDLVTK
jgi:hypothetical protein